MALIGQTDEWLMGEGWLDRERSLTREEPLSPSPHGFPDAHPMCASLASITSSTEQGLASAGRMESVRFLAVGEMGAVDLSVCSTLQVSKSFHIFSFRIHNHCARMRELPKFPVGNRVPQGGKVTSLKPNTWKTWAGFQPRSFQLQGHRSPSLHFSAWTTCYLYRGRK